MLYGGFMYTLGIETFLAVIRAGSLSKAAEDLNLAQTTVSQRLKVLEHELGLNLIERAKGIKHIKLTPTGEEFLKLAEQWGFIWQEAKLLREQGPKISLVVGSVDSFNGFVLPKVYRALTKHSPPIKLEIRTSHSIDLYAEVEKRQVDIAFVLRHLCHPAVNAVEYFSTPMVILRSGEAARHRSQTVHPSELNPNHELYMPWGQDNFRAWHEHWWPPSTSSRIKLDNTQLLLNLLQDPAQWAIVPLWMAKEAMKRGHYSIYQLTDPPPDYTCYKLTHKNPTSLTMKALDIFDHYFHAVNNL